LYNPKSVNESEALLGVVEGRLEEISFKILSAII